MMRKGSLFPGEVAAMRFLSTLLTRLREFHSVQRELVEREHLLERPWEEELLHWSMDGDLHGRIAPPPDGSRRSTTRHGWCPGLRK